MSRESKVMEQRYGLYFLGEELDAAVTWANHTFTEASQQSRLEHLRREVAEFLDTPCAEEAADVLLLLAHWAAHAGVNLATAVHMKMEQNRRRQWGVPDADGVVEHQRGVSS